MFIPPPTSSEPTRTNAPSRTSAALAVVPPMSKAIMAPRIMARTTLLPVCIEASHSLIECIATAIGGPKTSSISAPTATDDGASTPAAADRAPAADDHGAAS